MKIIRCFFFLCLLPFACMAADLPQVIIIGAQNSGTGPFYKILCQHPQIVNKPAEVHFFDIHFNKGLKWYKEQFANASNPEDIQIDKTPYYLFHPLAAERAYSILPNAKLIVLLRNPIDRAYSQYQMNRLKGREHLSFVNAFRAEAHRLAGEKEKIIRTGVTPSTSNHRHFSYLARGLYIDQLKQWFNYYPREQVLVISYEDFLQNPESVIQETLAFIGLPDYPNFNFEQGKEPNYRPMYRATRQKLSDYFRSSTAKLEAFLNRSFNWD